jgi:glycosyltransferase involved in cell wall biosynthesis
LRRWPLHLNKFLYQFGAAWKALELHKQHAFDGAWAMMAHSAGVPAALFTLVYPNVKLILTLQEGDPPEYVEKKMRILWPLFKRAFVTAEVVQPISNFLAAWARRMGTKGEIVVIPNGVDTARFSDGATPSDVTELQDELGKKMGDVYLVTSSRLVHKNAVDDLILSLTRLSENVRLLILGSGPDEEKLKRLAEEAGVADRVIWKGHVGHGELPAYLKASDIFVRASRSEGMGNSFIEAMAAGVPVVATQEGGIADFLFDEQRNPDKPVTGWAVDTDSPEDIARAVTEIMSRREKVGAVVRTARALVVERYDWNRIAGEMKDKVFSRV